MNNINSVEVKPLEVNPVEVNPVGAHSMKVNPVEINPVEVNPVGVHSMKVNPVGINSVEVDSVEVNPAVASSVEVNPIEVNPVEINSVEVDSIGKGSGIANSVNVNSVVVKTITPLTTRNVKFLVSQPSHETIQVEVENGVLEEIFVPKCQTHQISVVRGKVILVVWQNGTPQDISLEETSNKVVIIHPEVHYGFINLHLEPSVVINAVLHYQGSDKKMDCYPAEESVIYTQEDSEAVLKVIPRNV